MTLTLKKLLLVATLMLCVSANAMAAALTILPDYHLTPRWVKAGAYFKDNGKRVHVDQVNIHVMLPKKRVGDHYVYGVRDHNESNVGEPDWSGWWDEPWHCGFFYYTVTASYHGHRYQRMFYVRRNQGFLLLENAADLAKAIAATQAGQ